MSRVTILLGSLIFINGCSQQVEQAAAPDSPEVQSTEEAANASPDTQATENELVDARPIAKSANESSGENADESKGRLRDEHEDTITTRIGRVILDLMDEIDGGTDEERDAAIATLKLNDDLLHRASGRRAKQLILRNNNRPRSLYVPPPPE